MQAEPLEAIYGHRFSDSEVKAMNAVWRVLVPQFFQRFVKPGDVVVDIGAGRCQFINNIRAAERVAVDANPANQEHCAPDVRFICSEQFSADLLPNGADAVFLSNFLEHLETAAAVLAMMKQIRALLRPGGRVIILQPNFALLGAAYFDFIDHKTILTHKSLREALEISGFRIIFEKRRFLPYTSKTSLPKWPFLVRLYLQVPLAQWLLGKQTVMVAVPTT